MARITSFACNPLPWFSSTAATSKPAKHVSYLLFSSAGFFSKPIKLIADGPQDRKLSVVTRYGVESDDEFEDEEEDEVPDPGYDPNLDIERLRSSTVRLLDFENNLIGLMAVREAQRKALNEDAQLVIISAEAVPPVVRLFDPDDYRKFKFEKLKKKRDQMRKPVGRLKEIKLGYKIDIGDYTRMLKKGMKFVKAGKNVKVMVNMRGRDNVHKESAIELLRQFQRDLGPLAMEQSANFEEKNIYIILAPNKANIQREEDLRKREEHLKNLELTKQSESESGELSEQIEKESEELPEQIKNESEESTEQIVNESEKSAELTEQIEKESEELAEQIETDAEKEEVETEAIH